MEEEKKKTAREIIENYDGPKVRIMEGSMYLLPISNNCSYKHH